MCLLEWGLSTYFFFFNLFFWGGGGGNNVQIQAGLSAHFGGLGWWVLRTLDRSLSIVSFIFLTVYVLVPRACRKGQVWVRLHV